MKLVEKIVNQEKVILKLKTGDWKNHSYDIELRSAEDSRSYSCNVVDDLEIKINHKSFDTKKPIQVIVTENNILVYTHRVRLYSNHKVESIERKRYVNTNNLEMNLSNISRHALHLLREN